MLYSTFNQTKNNQLEEPIFLGQSVNLSRFDQQRFEIFEKLKALYILQTTVLQSNSILAPSRRWGFYAAIINYF